MYCKQCGKPLPLDANFCSNCGARIDKDPAGKTVAMPIEGQQPQTDETVRLDPADQAYGAYTQKLSNGVEETVILEQSEPADETTDLGSADASVVVTGLDATRDMDAPYAAPVSPIDKTRKIGDAPQPSPFDPQENDPLEPAVYEEQARVSKEPVVVDAVPGQRRSPVGIIVIIVAIVAALAACGVAGWNWYQGVQAQKAYEAAHMAVPVTFSIDAPGYNAASDMPVHLRLTGTDLDGNAVKEYVVASSGQAVDLLRGEYKVKAVASPILSDGTMFEVPAGKVSFTVEDAQGISVPTVSFSKKIDPMQVTDEQIEASRKMAVACGMGKKKAQKLADAAAQARSDAKAAYERKQQEAKYHVEGSYFEFDIPEEWWGKVEWSKQGQQASTLERVTIYAAGLESVELCTLRVVTGSAPETTGDIENSVIWTGKEFSGKHIEMWAKRWAYIALYMGSSNIMGSAYTKNEINQGVSLQTGGKYTGDELIAQGRASNLADEDADTIVFYCDSYLSNLITPSIKTM